MKKVYTVIIAICMVMLVSTAAFAHGRPEAYVDLGYGSITQYNTTGDQSIGYDIGGAYPSTVFTIPYKVWLEYSSQPSLEASSFEFRIGSPLIHWETLHIHPCLSYTQFTYDDLDISAVMAGVNYVIGIGETDIEGYLGYSLGYSTAANNGNTSLTSPAFVTGKIKWAYGLTDNLELLVGYRFTRYTATNVDGNDGSFTLGLNYAFGPAN